MRTATHARTPLRQQSGFSLVELALVILIIGIMIAFFLPTNMAVIVGQKRANTIQKMANIESAITNFVVVNRRLPCPADGTLLTGVEARVVATGDCTGSQASGVIPWVALGMTLTDTQDSWNNQFTYRVGYGLTRDAALDMTLCDPAGTALESVTNAAPLVNLGVCRATCTGTFAAANCTSPANFLQRKGLDVLSAVGTTAMNYLQGTGAAYVLISHGENAYGAISITSVNSTYRSSAERGIAGTTLENPNRNLATLTVTAGAPPQLMDATYSNGEVDTTYFDDIVVRPLLFSVISKAQLGPRTH